MEENKIKKVNSHEFNALRELKLSCASEAKGTRLRSYIGERF